VLVCEQSDLCLQALTFSCLQNLPPFTVGTQENALSSGMHGYILAHLYLTDRLRGDEMKQIMLLVFTMVICGCATIAPTPNALLELRLADTRPGPGLSEMAFPGSSQPVFLSNVPVIRNADIAYAQVTTYSDAPAVAITFTKTGEIKFCDITSANIGKPMAVLVDGKLVNVAPIRERFCGGMGGRAIITGNFSAEEAKRIAATFPDGPADAVKVNSVWQGTGDQSKPALSYPMILFVNRRENGLIKVTGRIDANGVVAFSEDKVIYGEATDQRQGVLAGAKYTAKLDKMTLQGNGDWTDPKTKEVVKLTFFLELAK
jgi:hypothetical protein